MDPPFDPMGFDADPLGMSIDATDLCNIAARACRESLGLASEAGASDAGELAASAEPDAELADDCIVSGCVRVSGEWHGAIIVELDAELARGAAARFHGLPLEAVNAEETLAALSEVLEKTGDAIRSHLPRPCQTWPPVVVRARAYPGRFPGTAVVAERTSHHVGAPLRISVLSRTRVPPHVARVETGVDDD